MSPLRAAATLVVLAVGAFADVSYLDNGQIRLGIDLKLDGVITYLAVSGGDNPINSFDYGRQIQQSYYSGPQPYGQAHPKWANWPWNPIGTGGVYGNRARVLASRNDGVSLWVRSVPMQWALNNVPCECTFETWIALDGNVATVRSRLNNHRTDRKQYGARDQELPAVYTNGTYFRLFTYDGDTPFTSPGALRGGCTASPRTTPTPPRRGMPNSRWRLRASRMRSAPSDCRLRSPHSRHNEAEAEVWIKRKAFIS